MTSDTHERCTDRTEEAVKKLKLNLDDDDFVLMVQGDEALVSPAMLSKMSDIYFRDKPQAINLVSRLHRIEDHDDPNTVKAVCTPEGKALFFKIAHSVPGAGKNCSNVSTDRGYRIFFRVPAEIQHPRTNAARNLGIEA